MEMGGKDTRKKATQTGQGGDWRSTERRSVSTSQIVKFLGTTATVLYQYCQSQAKVAPTAQLKSAMYIHTFYVQYAILIWAIKSQWQ